MAIWVEDLEAVVYSKIKNRTYGTLLKKFPNILYTTVQTLESDARFPVVYIHMLPMVEKGQDLEGSTINAVLATIQIDVIANTSKSDASTIMWSILEAVKELRFEANELPLFYMEEGLHKSTMRARRMIGSADKI